MLESLQLVPETKRQREELLGIEGYIASKYFACWRQLCAFPGRIPQGRDKYNSSLNYGYGILYNEVERACLYVGLDPYLGLYHSERYGKPSLVLDLVEEFRVPIVDSAILPLFVDKDMTNDKYFRQKAEDQYELSSEGKAVVVTAAFSRLKQEVVWGGTKQTVQEAITHQVRSLSHYFMGQEQGYKPFELNTVLKNGLAIPSMVETNIVNKNLPVFSYNQLPMAPIIATIIGPETDCCSYKNQWLVDLKIYHQ